MCEMHQPVLQGVYQLQVRNKDLPNDSLSRENRNYTYHDVVIEQKPGYICLKCEASGDTIPQPERIALGLVEAAFFLKIY